MYIIIIIVVFSFLLLSAIIIPLVIFRQKNKNNSKVGVQQPVEDSVPVKDDIWPEPEDAKMTDLQEDIEVHEPKRHKVNNKLKVMGRVHKSVNAEDYYYLKVYDTYTHQADTIECSEDEFLSMGHGGWAESQWKWHWEWDIDND